MVHTAEITLGSLVDRLRPEVDLALHRYVTLPEGCPSSLREAMAYSLLAPGKRLRPMLVLLAAEACQAQGKSEIGNPKSEKISNSSVFQVPVPPDAAGGLDDSAFDPQPSTLNPQPSILARAMPAACAVEMVHAYSLVHDDLPAMDDDDLRRGRPTCHRKFGEATAILAGDALLTLAFEALAKDVRPPALAAACCAEMAASAGACHLVGGQADDVEGSGFRVQGSTVVPPDAAGGLEASSLNPQPVSLLESIHRRKTGAMICVSLRLGAMIAGADPTRLDALDRYGRALGLAFQITDDLLDVRGSEEAVGKRVGKDFDCGKLTFPMLLGVEESFRRAEALVEEACRALAPLNCSDENAAAGLEAVARYVLERNR